RDTEQIVDRGCILDGRNAAVGRLQRDPGGGVVADHRVTDEQLGAAGGAAVLNALLAEIADHAVLDGNRLRGEDADADGAGGGRLVEALELDASDADAVVDAGVDGDAGGALDEDRSQ